MKPQEIIQFAPDAVVGLDRDGAVRAEVHGSRAHMLARLTTLGLPVPPGVALSFDCVRHLAEGGPMPKLPPRSAPDRLLCLRPSPRDRAWGGPSATLNIGITARDIAAVEAAIGVVEARELYARLISTYALMVHGVDPEGFEALAHRILGPGPRQPEAMRATTEAMLRLYAEETDEEFPDDAADQLEGIARAMALDWDRASARILRQAKGGPAEGGLGLIVQELALGVAPGVSGAGHIQIVDPRTGAPSVDGAFLPGKQRAVTRPGSRRTGVLLARGRREGCDQPALEEMCPEALEALRGYAGQAAQGLGDAVQLYFILENGAVSVVDAVPARRGARASVRIAVDLANRGAITREQALLRVEPRNLIEHLHPQIDASAARDVWGGGLAASPGAATGYMVFTSEAAMQAAAQGEDTILVRLETGPEDVRGMHAAKGVLTIRGGMTSHAAVLARGLGLPAVVGASDLRLDLEGRRLVTPDARVLHEGALITIDGTRGEVLAGAPRMVAPDLGGALAELLDWADAARDLGVRANADTPADSRVARDFRCDGLGLCRTEHMFFDPARLTVMREMILADTPEERRAALDLLLPMQRADFEEIFSIMRGMPVTIRLLDPPLNEFLPHDEDEMEHLASAMGIPAGQVKARARELAEVNPMLGMRGVRLGVALPEIYEMQARAIFEAAIAVNRDARDPVVPEVMIPLVSAYREVELVKHRIDAVARAVEEEQGEKLDFSLGVMVETPRAALRAGDLAEVSEFLSFGTNDLTQMTYGLSRDDAGRFMRDYVREGVFPEDPFHTLDIEGVGELMLIAARRGRARNPNLKLGLCGEHGGDPASVRFCRLAGFDYVSCSPFRVPIARLAAAQATILVGKAGAEAVASA
ncbi:putative PEP-binding protein [Amaricoccus solimangrovi]|uniref:Pyruvate, phosphate dikinase n=1 Tax=Amaricoccus solimangrovi TaxID=2589815 RepID=A0A501WPI4_9RHOB|nr:putative PEP-binding protein [Amaricoccus solimangrovi]TPE50762.1 pyruvate, phosphate dikinase [Amaricoccus solimangrovi]